MCRGGTPGRYRRRSEAGEKNLIQLSLASTHFNTVKTVRHGRKAQPKQSAASAAAPAEKVKPPPEANKLLHKGGEIKITKTCGCAAECPEGFSPSEASSCYTQGGECRDKEKDPKCTLTCKKGKEEKKVDGKCIAVYR